jgi:hypothetical protein
MFSEPQAKTKTRAVYEAMDPLMDGLTIMDGRGDLMYPVVLWVKALNHNGWNRCSPIVELKVARRWAKAWSKTMTVAITPASRISKTIQLPRY